MADVRKLGREWSQAYALACSRLDNQSMLYLMGLVSWPPLTSMYGDLVDDLTLICTLLSKKPMVGYLVAKRLQLQEERTRALLCVLEEKGYIKAVGVHLTGDLNVFSPAPSHTVRVASRRLYAPGAMVSVEDTSSVEVPAAADTAAVLKQLWRVLNTDISLTRRSSAGAGIESGGSPAETSDVLSQLWCVLNTDIVLKKSSADNSVKEPSAQIQARTEAETEVVMAQLWRVLNTEIAFKRQTGADSNEKVDVTGEAAALMSQLWRVLNTEIAFKRNANPSTAKIDKDTGREAADRLSQLWRVLRTEIAFKQQPNTGTQPDETTDTSGEASDRLTQLWRILNAEITVTLPPEGKK